MAWCKMISDAQLHNLVERLMSYHEILVGHSLMFRHLQSLRLRVQRDRIRESNCRVLDRTWWELDTLALFGCSLSLLVPQSSNPVRTLVGDRELQKKDLASVTLVFRVFSILFRWTFLRSPFCVQKLAGAGTYWCAKEVRKYCVAPCWSNYDRERERM